MNPMQHGPLGGLFSDGGKPLPPSVTNSRDSQGSPNGTANARSPKHVAGTSRPARKAASVTQDSETHARALTAAQREYTAAYTAWHTARIRFLHLGHGPGGAHTFDVENARGRLERATQLLNRLNNIVPNNQPTAPTASAASK